MAQAERDVRVYWAAWMGSSPVGDAQSVAIDDKGHLVGSWISSSESWARIDLPRRWPGEDVTLVWVERGTLPAPCPGCKECAGALAGPGHVVDVPVSASEPNPPKAGR